MKWEKLNHNEVLHGDGFYISYLPDTSRVNDGVDGAFISIASLLTGAKTEKTETALWTKQTPHWRILNGDFRKEYEEAFLGGLEACLAVYEKHKASARCDWSTD